MPPVNFPLGERGIFVPTSEWAFPNGAWTLTRSSAGIYFHRKTAAAATSNPYVSLSQVLSRAMSSMQAGGVNAPLGVEVESIMLTGFDLIYAVNTAALTSLTPVLTQATFQDSTAVNVNLTPGGVISTVGRIGVNQAITANAITPLGGVNATPFAVRFALAAPYIIGANRGSIADYLELAVVDPGTAVFDLYGIGLLCNANR